MPFSSVETKMNPDPILIIHQDIGLEGFPLSPPLFLYSNSISRPHVYTSLTDVASHWLGQACGNCCGCAEVANHISIMENFLLIGSSGEIATLIADHN